MSAEKMLPGSALEVEDLTVAYDIKPVLWDVDLQLPAGQLTAIVGPNGAGKSTLLKAVLGLLKPISGQIRYPQREDGTPLRIGYVPQNSSVDWDFPATVLDVVTMGRYGLLGWVRRPGKQDREIARRMLKRVGMAEYETRQISQLSGGQQQRVFLARALVQEADIYFMDEPFKGVDIKTEKIIVDILRELRAQEKTVVVVHHNIETVKEYFDWVVLINVQVVASGPVEQAFSQENIQKTYHVIEAAELGKED